MTQRCGDCGVENLDDARFCASCGIALSTEHLTHPGLAALVADEGTTPAAPPTSPSEHVPEPTTTVTPAAPPPTAPSTAPPPVAHGPVEVRPASDRSWITPTIVVFGILAIAAVVLAVLVSRDGDSTSSPIDATAPATTDAATSDTTVPVTTDPAVASTVEPSTTDVATTVPETTPPIDDVAAQEALTETAAADLGAVTARLGRWVPQLSAKRDGTEWEGVTYGLGDILDLHESLDAEFGTVLVEGSSFAFILGGERMTDWWITLADIDFDDPDAALDWCVDAGFDRSNCAARLITDDDTATGTLRLRPA